jgi:hypothetical protein
MTNKQFLILLLTLLTSVAIIAMAQNPNLTPYQFTVGTPHTSCNVSAAGQANYCYGSDGPYVSINGAAYVSMLAGAPAAITATAPLVMSGSTLSCPSCGPVYTAAAPVTITGSVISLPNAALKTQIDTLGLVAAQSAVQ